MVTVWFLNGPQRSYAKGLTAILWCYWAVLGALDGGVSREEVRSLRCPWKMILRPQLLLFSPCLLAALSERPPLLPSLAVTCWAATGTQQKTQATMVTEA